MCIGEVDLPSVSPWAGAASAASGSAGSFSSAEAALGSSTSGSAILSFSTLGSSKVVAVMFSGLPSASAGAVAGALPSSDMLSGERLVVRWRRNVAARVGRQKLGKMRTDVCERVNRVADKIEDAN